MFSISVPASTRLGHRRRSVRRLLRVWTASHIIPNASPINFLTLAFLVVSLVYLADVRPAVREVSGGSRW